MWRVLFLVFVFVPWCSHAAVLINEIAWMGSGDDANNEWLELYNSGSASISLDGWVLTDGNTLDIPLVGTLGAGNYAVLERTDDGSAPGAAFLVYTGALGNDGRTLVLMRADGSIEDQVIGGENWEAVGGDNATKDTAQRTGSGWVTARPTPGVTNTTSKTPAPVTTSSSNVSSGTAKPSLKTAVPTRRSQEVIEMQVSDSTLALSLIAPTVVYVNQPITFVVEPRDVGSTIEASLRYTWNFGDATESSGQKTVTHTYAYPGEYVVVAHAAYAQHEAFSRQVVTVLPVMLTLGRAENGDILIANESPYELDLSKFMLRGDHDLVFPEHTILLEAGTLRIARERVESGASKMIALYDRARTIAASSMPYALASAAVATEEPVPRHRAHPLQHPPQSSPRAMWY
jgi:hypothetical protein